MDYPMINENVMKWACYMADLYSVEELYSIEDEDDVVIYDDSNEWYNIYVSEADV